MYGESDYQEEILEAEKAFQVKYFSSFAVEVKYFFFCFGWYGDHFFER